ncbi:MAG: 4Fe-4S binding protein, partial [Anaerolineae bacterium]|nr:4Fe-4S binding protein [Anaerolineae bacterium]
AASPLADLFFRLDPLNASAAMLASRSWIPRLAPALATLVLTLIVGRVWCGWICPLGTLLDWVRFPAVARRSQSISPRWRQVKTLLLIGILAMALLGSLFLLLLDPLALLTRTMTTAVLPVLNHTVTSLEHTLYSLRFLRPLVDWMERVLRGPVLPVTQPAFAHRLLIGLLFATILGLNALADRFWCRYLCPLGALLGLLSEVSILRPNIPTACNRCGHCVSSCPVDAIGSGDGYEIEPAECIVCMDCLAACPESSIGIHPTLKVAASAAYDPGRREILASVAASAISVALLKTAPQTKQVHPHLVRPPGADDEEEFLSRCLRCSQCMKVCPTSGLQPVLFEAGVEGVWTPSLVPRLGYCDYGCNNCGQVCPSGAIPALTLGEKRQAVMGEAVVDRDRCLPWAQGIPCIVCEEMCPVPEKAVRLENEQIANDAGEIITIQKPYVLQDLCIGCGICEYQCPMGGDAAIRVYHR